MRLNCFISALSLYVSTPSPQHMHLMPLTPVTLFPLDCMSCVSFLIVVNTEVAYARLAALLCCTARNIPGCVIDHRSSSTHATAPVLFASIFPHCSTTVIAVCQWKMCICFQSLSYGDKNLLQCSLIISGATSLALPWCSFQGLQQHRNISTHLNHAQFALQELKAENGATCTQICATFASHAERTV